MALAVVLLSDCAAVAPALAQDAPAARSAAARPYAAHVAEAARRFGIADAWIWAVLRVESGGVARALSPAGAIGLMQIMPATWADLRVRYGLGLDPFDPHDNIMAGAAYLRAMHDRYGDTAAMLAAYNAGPSRYEDHLARGRPLPAETVRYLARLTPIVGVPRASPMTAAVPADPFAWRRATLFVRTANGASAGDGAPSSGTTSAPDPVTELSALGADAEASTAMIRREDALFVPRAHAGRPQ